jgi:hypothetical protein
MDEAKQALSPSALDQAEAPDETWVWRLDQFIALGFDVGAALRLADDRRIELAQARQLVALGCPLETASRILL